MPKSRIPSPARSQSGIVTPRRQPPRRSRSMCSPALSTASGRLTSIIDQFKNKNTDSFALSPLTSRRSVLSDNTDIEEPRRKSWWKNLNENSRDVMEVLESNKASDVNNEIEDIVDIEVLSQEKKNYTLDLPESSDNESINSIVLPQRKLFTQKENQPQKKFGQLVGARETLAKLHKTNTTMHEKTVNAGTKDLFQASKRSKPIFPAALLNISPNKTAADKTKENIAVEPKAPVRNIFGNRPANKRKNMFADFIVSESEDEISDIQPKVFGFQKKVEQQRLSSTSKGREHSPTSSITTDMELDDWKHLPSSTMVENQLDEMVASHTPVKRARLSKLSEVKESDIATTTNTTEDKTKSSNKSVSKTRTSLRTQNSSRTANTTVDKTKELNKSKNKTRTSPRSKNTTVNEEIPVQDQDKTNKSATTRTELAAVLDDDDDDENNFTLTYENDDEVEEQQQFQSAPNKRQSSRISNKSRNATVIEKDNVQDKDKNAVVDKSLNKSIGNKSLSKSKGNKSLTKSTLNISPRKNEVNKSINTTNKSINKSVANKSLQKATKIVEESQESDQQSIQDNVDGVLEDENINVEKIEKKAEDDMEVEEQENKESDIDRSNKSQENEGKESMQIDEQEDTAGDEIPNESQGTEDNTNEENTANATSEKEEEQIEESQEVDQSEEVEQTEEENEEDSQEVENVEKSQENEDIIESAVDNDVHVSQEVENETNEGEVNESHVEEAEIQEDEAEINESREVHDEANVSQQDEENQSEGDDNEVDQSEEVEDEVNQSQEDDEANESQEVDDEANESQEVDDEANESQEVEDEMNQSQEDDEANESQEVDNEEVNQSQEDDDVDQSQEVDEEAEESEEEEDEAENNETANESQDLENEGADDSQQVENEEANESQEVENDEDEELDQSEEVEESKEDNDESQELENENQSEDDEEMDYSVEADQAIASDDMSGEEQEEMEVDEEENRENEAEIHSEEVIEDSPNVTHDTTGRNRKKVKSPEVVRHDLANQQTSFMAKGRNTSIRKTKSMYNDLNIRPSLAPARDSLGLSERDSSAEGSGWDSHRTTRKTLRQTFGKDFSVRKSLRALVMEKSAKQMEHVETLHDTVKFPQANSTEYVEDTHHEEDMHNADNVTIESDHEVSRRTRQTTLETYLQNIKQQNLEKKMKMEQAIRNSLKAPPVRDTLNLFKVPTKPPPRKPKPTATKPKKQIKSAILFGELPSEVIEDMKYKPPKRFQPANASWITKRLYKFLETKLEPKYDYKARVRAEKLVESLYQFCKDLRRVSVASPVAVDALKQELARLDVVRTHFDFYEFFHEYMPREVRVKVVPDVVNKISLPRHGVFTDILRGNNVQG